MRILTFMKTLLTCVLLLCGCATLPKPPAIDVRPVSPSNTPLQICWLELGGTEVSGGLGAAGSTTASIWQVTTSALLIRHPAGDLLVDTGTSPKASEEAKELPGWKHFVFEQTAGLNVQRGDLKSMLQSLGVEKPQAIVLSHAHADHLGGVAALPETPVWMAPEEARFIEADLAHHRGVVIPPQGRALQGRTVELQFDSGPYLNYAKSHDVFGDGSVVLVPSPGHTPGSVVTFINAAEHQLAHVGDLINLTESIERRVPKGFLMRALTDEDPAATDAEVARLVALHEAVPSLTILPAHDRVAWEALFGRTAVGEPPRCVSWNGSATR